MHSYPLYIYKNPTMGFQISQNDAKITSNQWWQNLVSGAVIYWSHFQIIVLMVYGTNLF